jgi:hypothetical protein
LLVPTRPEDAPQKVGFMDDKWLVVPGNQGAAEATAEAVYLAIAVRNVGSGIAVLHGWYFDSDLRRGPREDDGWYATVARHWNIDRPDPR